MISTQMITLYYHQYKYKIGISLIIIIVLLYLIYSNYHHLSTDILSINDIKDTPLSESEN